MFRKPIVFITGSPDSDNCIVIHFLAGGDPTTRPDLGTNKRVVAHCPGAAGIRFDHFLRVFIEVIMGWDIVFFSILGIVALSGVVVNASLVLVHTINRRRSEGMALLEAVRTAGILRFRPIALTSATTYIGLLPLMFEGSVPARPLIPMAISLGYGVMYASVMTLFLVPCGYVIIDDLTKLLRRGSSAETPQKT